MTALQFLEETSPLVRQYRAPAGVFQFYEQGYLRNSISVAKPIAPSWQAEVEAQLAQMRNLAPGWDGYGSPAIPEATLAFAKSVLASTMSITSPPPSIVPIHGGGLQLEWHRNGYDIELVLFSPNSAEIAIQHVDGREVVETELSTDFSLLGDALNEIE